MKLTNEQIYSIQDGLMRILFDNNFIFPAKTSYKLLQNYKIIEPVHETLDEIRVNLTRQYGEYQEDGNLVISKDDLKIVNKELSEVGKIEQDLPLFTINIEEIGDKEIPTQILRDLMPIIEME